MNIRYHKYGPVFRHLDLKMGIKKYSHFKSYFPGNFRNIIRFECKLQTHNLVIEKICYIRIFCVYI